MSAKKSTRRLAVIAGALGCLVIMATLEAASSGWPDRRIVTVFQPHLYSRTRDFKEEFARSFFNSDVLIVTEIYPAREEPIPGIDGDMLAELVRRYGHRGVHYVADKEDLAEYMLGVVQPGDTVITMGAGDIYRYGREFVKALTDQRGAV